jgi:hypothetical protein
VGGARFWVARFFKLLENFDNIIEAGDLDAA